MCQYLLISRLLNFSPAMRHPLKKMRSNSFTWLVLEFLTFPSHGGFRPAQHFLSAKYHAGTMDTGEDLRPGASDTWSKFCSTLCCVSHGICLDLLSCLAASCSFEAQSIGRLGSSWILVGPVSIFQYPLRQCDWTSGEQGHVLLASIPDSSSRGRTAHHCFLPIKEFFTDT